MRYIIGIDIGTTNIKSALYNEHGFLLDYATISYPSYSRQENLHEQNPDDWVNGVINLLKRLIINNKIQNDIEAISISTQGGTVVPIDSSYNPIYNAMTWLDRRGLDLYEENNELTSRNIGFYKKTGWRLDSCMSFLPLYWLKKNKKDIFSKIYKILFVNDYVMKKISNIHFQDPSNASISLFYNIKSNKWDTDILKLLDLHEDNFSVVKNSGEVIGSLKNSICKKIGIKKDVKIVNGGHDQYCAAIGAGIFNEIEVLLTTGSAWVIFKTLNKPLFDVKRFFSIGRSIIKDKYGLIYTIPAAGISLNWFSGMVMNLKSEKELYKIEDLNKSKIENIRNNIIFLPYLTGSFGPDFKLNQKSAFLNLEIGHNFLDMEKAIMEGIGFQLRRILEILIEKGVITDTIKMVGGATKSSVWPQVIADITNKTILIPIEKDIDFATKGAAIIAGYGSGIFNSLEDGYKRFESEFKRIKPISKNVDFYNNKYELFIKFLNELNNN